ncbi:hypothetical protein [Arthrobacter roseus]|uniref:hypothetical protein n=1 Tax=Arthrobacter roseus TaxID=136274 RepID=UPI001962B62E|nr:hypothetical protein [Arthrobacter roseus]MBM7847611.1 hypothetical protein [Arthrobacter roseus]
MARPSPEELEGRHLERMAAFVLSARCVWEHSLCQDTAALHTLAQVPFEVEQDPPSSGKVVLIQKLPRRAAGHDPGSAAGLTQANARRRTR